MRPTNESLLHRGVLEVIEAKHLQERLEKGDKLRVKLGIDPSAPELHIGHAVPLRKLREFQHAGHTAVLIIGDYTAQIGDPTGKNESRVMLTPDQVRENAATYLEQAYLILDRTRTEVRYQSEWFGQFTPRDFIELMAATTASNILSHETFAKRLQENLPLYMHELMYPLLQGYDSVAVKADVELGGIDQKFNVLMGRVVQRAYNLPEQDVMLFPYLPGTDGKEKMSKSLGNTINLDDSPSEMFGKTMSIPDSLIATYFELATEVPSEKVESIKAQLQDATVNPKQLKMDLAWSIVREYHSAKLADEARASFDKQFSAKEIPDAIETLKLAPNTYDLSDILVSRTTLVASKSEFRRLIEQKGIKKNQTVVTDPYATVSPDDGEEVVIQIGSRRFVKVAWKGTHGA